MANAKLRRILLLGALSGLTITLAACEPDYDQEQVQGTSLFSDAALSSGWSMTDLAGIEPALLSGSYSEMPQALPMQASWDGGYDYAPAYDYAPEADGYYEPLDESYYTESSGSDDYLWLALAAALAGMLGDSPPDYAFGYEGVQPWAWETGDRYVRYAEPVDSGYRYYYYEPDSYRPFLVRDPYYSYGYREDRLMVIYDRHGRIVDGNRAYRQRLAARDYYSRGEHLYRAGHKHQRFGVPARLWDGHRDKIKHERREWEEARRDRDNWQRWDARYQQRLRRDWAGEALVRREAERGFAKWQQADYRSNPPKFYSAESRREQLRKVAELRREQTRERRAEQRREERARAQDREQRERAERRVNSQPQAQFQKASLVSERANARAERANARRSELRRESGDRQQRDKRIAERQKTQTVQHQAEGPRRNAELKQRAAAQKDRVAERRQQARSVEQRRKEQQAERKDQQRQAAREASDRAQRQASQDVRRREQTKQKAAREARQERASKDLVQAQRRNESRLQSQIREDRRAQQDARQQRQVEREQQRAQRQAQREQVDHQKERAERQAQREQVNHQQQRQERQAQREQVNQQQRRAERQTQRQHAREAPQQEQKAERRKQQRAERQTQRREQTR